MVMGVNKTGRTELSRADVIKCHALLAEHLHRIEGGDWWKFDEGWDDQRISIEVGGTATQGKVTSLRREIFGNTLPPKLNQASSTAELEAKIDALKRHLDGVDLRLDRLEQGAK